MAATSVDPAFPCGLDLHVPFPTARLADVALRAIQVDPELSPLVRRHLSVVRDADAPPGAVAEAQTLHVRYRAATNRMLRVAVNSFMDSLGLVLEVMEKLDVDAAA